MIKTKAEHRAALARIEELWDTLPGTPEREELDALVDLVEAYEEEHCPIENLDEVQIPDDLFQLALEYFGSHEATTEWFFTKHVAMGLATPASICMTPKGAQRVQDEINKLKSGMCS